MHARALVGAGRHQEELPLLARVPARALGLPQGLPRQLAAQWCAALCCAVPRCAVLCRAVPRCLRRAARSARAVVDARAMGSTARSRRSSERGGEWTGGALSGAVLSAGYTADGCGGASAWEGGACGGLLARGRQRGGGAEQEGKRRSRQIQANALTPGQLGEPRGGGGARGAGAAAGALVLHGSKEGSVGATGLGRSTQHPA